MERILNVNNVRTAKKFEKKMKHLRESHLPALLAPIAKLQPSLKKSHGIEIKSRAHLVVSRLKRVWERLVKFVGDQLFTCHKNFIFFFPEHKRSYIESC